MERMSFPRGFTWGAATSAYQVEGSPLADGAAPTAWHEFCRRRGRIVDGTCGDVACDHYRRWPEDVALLRALGLGAYRFSVGWGRVQPAPGRLNEQGLAFYERLVDGLLGAGIEPWLTVHHFDVPDWFAREGGFARREGVDRLLELGQVLFRRLGDRVRHWITVNEPTVYTSGGYLTGEYPPGKRLALAAALRSTVHLLLAHARLCEAWEAEGRGGMIGLAHNAPWVEPARPGRRGDRAAADRVDDLANRSILDPLLKGTWPPRLLSRLGPLLPRRVEDDAREAGAGAARPGRYVGINYYSRFPCRWALLPPGLNAREAAVPGRPRSAMWEVCPEGLHGMLARLRTEYGNPAVVITENGYPLPEEDAVDPWDDRDRICYLADHLAALSRAGREGSDVRGYFHWSLVDNFEWNLGLRMRFGLVRVDFATQERTPRRSAAWFAEAARTNAVPPVPAPLGP